MVESGGGVGITESSVQKAMNRERLGEEVRQTVTASSSGMVDTAESDGSERLRAEALGFHEFFSRGEKETGDSSND